MDITIFRCLQVTVLIFQVKAKPEGLHTSLQNAFPITIGTIPLWQNNVPQQPTAFGSPQQFASAPSAPPPDVGTSFAPSFPYPDMRKFLELVLHLLIHYQQTFVLRERNIYFISVCFIV
jgi:hypothetical protein